jgi:uncharacterized DUF497 family protein
MEFEWDLKKAKINLRQHKISFEEAAMFLAIFSLSRREVGNKRHGRDGQHKP